MKATVHHGHASVTRDGKIGSHVELHLHGEAEHEWSGIYKFASHGMTADQFAARVAELKAYHAAKMKRLNGFRELKMRDIVVDDAFGLGGLATKYRIIEANIIERGTDVELRLGVYLIGSLGHQNLVFTMGHENGLIFPTVDAIPDDDTIERIVRLKIRAMTDVMSAHERFKASAALLNAGVEA